MFKKLFGLISGVKKVKSIIDVLTAIADRADDDRDQNGKADALDIIDKLKAWEENVVRLAKDEFAKLLAIFEEAKKLAIYIKDGE